MGEPQRGQLAAATLSPLRAAPGKFPRRRFLLLSAAAVCLKALPTFAQADDSAAVMSDAEIDRLREVAPYPPQRLLVFISFLDKRTQAIEKLDTGRRRPGREEDLRDLMNQFASISDDLEDNLDDYSQRHLDVRRVLPKLVAATERWATMLRTPPEDEHYNVARKLSLTSLADVKESAEKMVIAQKTYFLAHPPPKNNHGGL